jgi:DNA-binding LacI/PurR family transcriptional regulator
VLKAARDMGYIPHAIGKALASRRTRSIGVAFSTEQASHPFLQLVIEGLSQATRNRDQRLLVESFDERDRAAKVLQLTRARQIDIDNREAARTAVDHLLDLGHRRIACITNAPTSCLSSADRLAGWREALHGRGAKPEATPSPSGP